MATITLQGNKIQTSGNLPNKGDKAPNFTLIGADMSKKTLADFAGQRVILNISPSIDTSTCATSVVKFNKEAANIENTTIIYVSKDLPFAQARFCGAEGIKNVITLSDFATGQFGKDYGLEILEGPIATLHSRAIVVIDENGVVLHTEQVAEIADEPNYESALNALQ